MNELTNRVSCPRSCNDRRLLRYALAKCSLSARPPNRSESRMKTRSPSPYAAAAAAASNRSLSRSTSVVDSPCSSSASASRQPTTENYRASTGIWQTSLLSPQRDDREPIYGRHRVSRRAGAATVAFVVFLVLAGRNRDLGSGTFLGLAVVLWSPLHLAWATCSWTTQACWPSKRTTGTHPLGPDGSRWPSS